LTAQIAFVVDCRNMTKPDWLHIEEISRLWGEETGLDAATFKKDLEEWFAGFVILERPTFEAYCAERGHPKPRFWFGGRLEEARRDKPNRPEPAEIPPEAKQPQPSEERSYVREESAPDLAAFQAQIASLSERLETPTIETPKLETPRTGTLSKSKRSGPDQQGLGADSGRTGTSAERNQQELIERVEVASAKARGLKAQLEAARQRIADLAAETEASRVSSMARPYAPAPASPEAPWHEPKTSPGFLRRGTENYRDPSATRQLPRQTTASRKVRGRVILVAGLAVPFVALLIWATVTKIQFGAKEPIPPSAETADTMAGPGSAVGGQPSAQPETAALSSERATGKVDLGGAVPQADAQVLAATQHQIARLTAAVEASDSVVARLRDKLAIARQAVETARQTRPAETNPEAETQQRELALAATAEASNLRAALAGAEQKLAALGTQLEAALGAVADADTRAAGDRVETARLHAALQQAKDQTDVKRRDLTLAATVSSARVAVLQRELKSAHQQIAELGRVRDAANADASGLGASLHQAEEQAEAIRQELTLELTASSARLATLQKELRAAQLRIADLSSAAAAAEEEAVGLREELAARQQEVAATQPPTAPSDQNPVADQKDPDQTQVAEDVEAAPKIVEILTAAEMSSDPVTSETNALRETVSPDDLLLEPGQHVDREVMVTGSVMWLLRRYWLQSGSGHMRMLIDVEGLQLDDRNKLKNAVVQIEFLAQVRARITGTIERQGSENYRLAAAELVFVE
jgi:hypothetical protein